MFLTVEKARRLIEKEISNTDFGKEPKGLYKPIRYIMQIGGKRMRPVLLLLSYYLFKDDVKKVLKPAIATEAFHNFTLMHDDIMDNASLRRGNPTVHEKWDVNTAILSGDVMLVKTYDLLLQSIPEPMLKDFLTLYNHMAAEVCEGQQLDMSFEKKENVTADEYIEMIRLKTAALLSFCMQTGAMLADASKKNQQLLKDCGYNIGIGFQLMDDLLDVYGDMDKFGKTIGADIVANKKTFLLITALSRAKGTDALKLRKLLSMDKTNADEKIKEVKILFDKLDVRTITELKINEYFSSAFKALSKAEAPLIRKNILKQYFEKISNREQ